MREFFASETYGLERRFPILETGRTCFFDTPPAIPTGAQPGDTVAVDVPVAGGSGTETVQGIVNSDNTVRRTNPDGTVDSNATGVIANGTTRAKIDHSTAQHTPDSHNLNPPPAEGATIAPPPVTPTTQAEAEAERTTAGGRLATRVNADAGHLGVVIPDA